MEEIEENKHKVTREIEMIEETSAKKQDPQEIYTTEVLTEKQSEK